MKKGLIILSVCALGLAACNSGDNGAAKGEMKPGAKIVTKADSINYALGAEYGRYLSRVKDMMGADYDKKMVMTAINDILDGKESLDEMQGGMVIRDYFAVYLPERNKKAGEEFLAGIAKEEGVQKTESGLYYRIKEQGSEVKPTDVRDRVKVLYSGRHIDGTEFDGNYETADTTSFALYQVIRGWQEGLQLIGEGGKITLWIPADMAYGKGGRPGAIAPNETLVFDIDLFEVTPYVDPAATEENAEEVAE